MKVAKNKKVTFMTTRTYKGEQYKAGRISISPDILSDFGITEEEPEIILIQDFENNCLIIKKA